ncbi:hypothetical protein COI51_12765 [Bacillus toyonensis]|uniref:hypothetical protein n=1 Tax=Bacillus toyonensis TaxID=155322 RepID=UPI000BF05011|nr:hypothetical protein [Bacillus toyonensis]PEM15269.1 hypothetical protein CN616_23235 [Bacillus toyonensis]PGB24853.1 hypothetical protein COM06_19620 [Bacillus toyonensis]PGC34660.1 hypothetical protein COM10_20340 [Bacillus toyonensis]PHF84373.1 hypothetical protein COI51_12765 [Bacillus toyonensis]PHF99856.1 hypothetical protein COI49_23370 [Bacillus toyonensis]
MSFLKILQLLFINYFRETLYITKTRWEKLFPEIGKFSRLFLLCQYGFSFVGVIILLIIDFDNLNILSYLSDLSDYEIYILLSLPFFTILIFYNRMCSYQPHVGLIYGNVTSFFTILLHNFSNLSSFIFINALLYKFIFYRISNALVIVLILEVALMCVIFSLHKRNLHSNLLQKIQFSLITLLVVSCFYNLQMLNLVDFTFLLSNKKVMIQKFFTVILIYLFVECTMFILKQYFNRWINNLSFLNMRTNISIHTSLISLFLLSILIVLSQISFIENLSSEITIIIFLIVVILKKQKYFEVLSFESYKDFLFYLKNIKYDFSQLVDRKIYLFIIILLPEILFYFLYLILKAEYDYALMLLLMFVLDPILDNLIIMMFPTILNNKKLLQIQSKYSLATVLLILIPISCINSYVNLGSVMFNFKITIIISLFIGLIFIMYFYQLWKKSFLKNLYKDRLKSGENNE